MAAKPPKQDRAKKRAPRFWQKTVDRPVLSEAPFPGYARVTVEQAQLNRKMSEWAAARESSPPRTVPARIGRLARLLAGSIRPRLGN
jgi:hypothetical protein